MDEQLRKLIEEISKHPPGSSQYRKTMHRLLIAIQKLPGLRKSSHPDYLHALDQTFEKISRDICRDFQPRSHSLTQDLLNWVNGDLKWRIKDLYIQDQKKKNKEESLDRSISYDREETNLGDFLASPTLEGLEGYLEKLQNQKIERIGLELESYIDRDPQKQLQNCYPRNYPQCNCQILSQRRFFRDPPDTFPEIAQELNMPLRPLTNHWFGRCLPLVQNIARDLGYNPKERS
jgi:hypothetical protein